MIFIFFALACYLCVCQVRMVILNEMVTANA